MIRSFKNEATEDIFNGATSKGSRRIIPPELWNIARRKLQLINAAMTINDLRVPPSNHLEKLSGDRAGQYSIMINMQYRICFYWEDEEANEVEITDYH